MTGTIAIDGLHIERVDGLLMVSRTEPADDTESDDDSELTFVPDPDFDDGREADE